MGTSITVTESITVTVDIPFDVKADQRDRWRVTVARAVRDAITNEHATHFAINRAVFAAVPVAKSTTIEHASTIARIDAGNEPAAQSYAERGPSKFDSAGTRVVTGD